MAQRQSGFERKAAEEYMTPEWVVETLCSVMPIYGNIWEPACGHGAIVNVLERQSHCTVIGSDINPEFSKFPGSWDFLDPKVQASYFTPSRGHFSIITNPPYGKQGRLAEQFVRAAISLTQFQDFGGRVAMLLPVDWCSARDRHDLFEGFRGHVTKITLTERIRWTNIPQSGSSPSQNHAWYIWDHSRKGRDIRWLGRVATQGEATA